MLQQTRVATVLPYYRRFLRRFRDLRALARGRTDVVLRLWAGLGYYRRARNLHRAAREVVARHAGRFPRELEAAVRLPGVGRYTSAAVLSIAYGAPLAVLDGNVARVLARLGALHGDRREARHWKKLQAFAQGLLATQAPGDWNQAMMELGATICTARAPRCRTCPVSRWCRAYRLGIAERLPDTPKKRATVRVTIAAAVLIDARGRTLVIRPSLDAGDAKVAALFSRMWQFPALAISRDAREELATHLKNFLALDGATLEPLPAARHTVTFREITLAPFQIRVDRLPQIPGARVLPLGQLNRLPVSNATRKIAAAARQTVA